MKTRGIFFAIALAIASNALASNWISVARGPDSEVLFDAQGLITHEDQRTVWVKYVYKHPQKMGDTKKTYFVYISYESFMCTNRTMTVYESVFYDKTGNVIFSSSYDNNASWEPIVPDSKGDQTASAVCAVKPTANPSPPDEATPPSRNRIPQ